MSLVSNLLTVNLIKQQVEMISSVQNRVHNSANILSQEIALDTSRGVDVSHKQKQLDEMKSQEIDLGKSLGSALQKSQKALNKTAKEKDSGPAAVSSISAKDPEALRKIEHKLSSDIMQLQNDDATENSQQIQKLQQQLQTIQTQLRQAESDNEGSTELANPVQCSQNSDIPTGNTLDIAI